MIPSKANALSRGTGPGGGWIKNANESKTICAAGARRRRCDDVFLQLFATDASIYEIKPLAVVRPHMLADVVATVQYAAENNLPIFPRGAGTGLAGESLGRGIVIDFSRYMRGVLSVDEESVRVQPGVCACAAQSLSAQLRSPVRA